MDLGSGRRGVDMGPSAIRIAGLHDRLRELGHSVVDEGDLDIKNIEELKVGDVRAGFLAEIARASRQVCTRVDRSHRAEASSRWCSAAITRSRSGTVSGIAARSRSGEKKVGLLWIDAHGDIEHPRHLPVGRERPRHAGRGAARSTGPAELTSIGGSEREVDPGQRRPGRHPQPR